MWASRAPGPQTVEDHTPPPHPGAAPRGPGSLTPGWPGPVGGASQPFLDSGSQDQGHLQPGETLPPAGHGTFSSSRSSPGPAAQALAEAPGAPGAGAPGRWAGPGRGHRPLCFPPLPLLRRPVGWGSLSTAFLGEELRAARVGKAGKPEGASRQVAGTHDIGLSLRSGLAAS